MGFINRIFGRVPELDLSGKADIARRNAEAASAAFTVAAWGLEEAADFQQSLAGEAQDAADNLRLLAEESEEVAIDLATAASTNRTKATRLLGLFA